ncbi:PEP-CTERM sorting domain-containing protein [Verrucomicrobiaceae bacterium N1E253]|uniref:PEP-CTERM sorting domain-containing protein n=1 Tax=Oceaniferula marina TaxID=2748318 RepID=A0A851GNC9_9BACT|nr:PEP-CTERM sorting domain-containing protein [Oceaniferula marina]NWK56537.1 PEP-CTERM sorting domain-containing protein [Oceaniferula marina]
MKYTTFTAACSLLSLSYAGAATSFTGGALNNAGNWDNGLPTAGNDGNIAVAGDLGNLDVNTAGAVSVNHTSATLTKTGVSYTDATFENSNAGGTLAWNMSGNASIDGNRVLSFDDHTTATISGGSIVSSGVGGSRLQSLASSTVVNITGGTFTNLGFWAVDGSLSLIGGNADLGTQNVRVSGSGSITMGGNFTLTGAATTAANNQYFFTGSTITLQADWSGSMSNANWDKAAWISEIESINLVYDGTTINGANFDTYFSESNGTITAIPEPSATTLLGLSGFALILRRRK